MKKNLGFHAILGMAILFSACSKDDDDDNGVTPNKNNTELLTAGKWQQTAFKQTHQENGETITEDYHAQLENCSKDDYTLFATNGTVTFDEGATKCDAADPQSTSGTWKFIENETKLVFSEMGFSDTVNIGTLNETTLKLNYSFTEDGITYNGERVLTRI